MGVYTIVIIVLHIFLNVFSECAPGGLNCSVRVRTAVHALLHVIIVIIVITTYF